MTVKKNVPKKKNTAKNQRQYIRFMLITIGVGVVLCIVVFYILFSMFAPDQKSPGKAKPDAGIEENTGETRGEAVELLGLVQRVDINGKEIQVHDIEQEKSAVVQVQGTTELKDKYGQNLILAEFKKGDIVYVIYDEVSGKAETIQLSGKTWELKSVQNIVVDTQGQTIRVGNQTYQYTAELIASYQGSPLDVGQIEAVDVVTLRGYKDKVWSLEMEKHHGYVTFKNKDKIVDGEVQINTNIFAKLGEIDKIPVTEGTHKVVVTAPGIEPHTQQIIVKSGEVVEIDLRNAQVKVGLVILRVNTDNYTVLINDVEQSNGTEPLLLNYGDYKLTVRKSGFMEWNRDLKVNTNQMEIPVELQKEIKLGTLVIDTDPTGADVYVNDTYIGFAPVQTEVEYGTHRVTVKMPGYIDWSGQLKIESARIAYSLRLHPQAQSGGSESENAYESEEDMIENP